MYIVSNIFLWVTLFIIPLSTSLLVSCNSIKDQTSSQTQDSKASKLAFSSNSLSDKNLFDEDLIFNDAQESTNFFTSDLGGPFDSSSDYGTLFDNLPSLPYFPEFGEIFRTTTPQPPFSFPDYVRDAFPDRPPENTSAGDRKAASTGRKPHRRPPRPASSGTRTKVTKQNQNEQREKPKVLKSKQPNKSKDYPKIFRFTSDRVNLAEFDTKKKLNENYLTLAKGDDLDSEKVKRNKFLILHGGVFEIERNGRLGLFPVSSEVNSHVTSPDNTFRY